MRRPPEQVLLFALPAGGVLAHQNTRETRVENEWARLIFRHRGGRIDIRTRQTDARLAQYTDQLGPPFWPSELDDKEFAISLKERDGQIRIVVAADLDTYPGLTLRREVTVGGGPIARIDHVLCQWGDDPSPAPSGSPAIGSPRSRHPNNAPHTGVDPKPYVRVSEYRERRRQEG